MTRTSRPFRLLTLTLVAGASIGAAVVALPGCGTRPPVYKQANSADNGAENPWPQVVAQLRKENDPVAGRRILGQLNNDLAATGLDPALLPAGLSPEQEKVLRETLGLNEEELKEVRPASYSNLDAHYLSDCLYLRDAARSLDADRLPPARQAELAFAWVCRQVVLNPWVLRPPGGQPTAMPPVPPTSVLRRGSGSGLERAYVLLALLQQLDLDGCLVGPPDAVGRSWDFAPPGAAADQPPKGPFWAVGVRAGADVLLFDPWRGEPLPGPNGQGVATLAQVKANPDLLKPWREDKARPWGVTPEELKAAVPFLAVPLSGTAPRMRRMEEELRSDLPVRLAVDPAGLRDRFASGAKLPDPKFWNPAGKQFTYTRALESFVPTEEGGFAPQPEFIRLYQLSLLPPSLFTAPPELTDPENGVPEAVERLRIQSLNMFAESFMLAPTPREQVQRGRFAEVTPRLVEKRQEFQAAQQRVQTDRNRGAAIAEWVKQAREVYTQLARARQQEKADPQAARDAQQAVERFWRSDVPTFQALIDLAVADAGVAESTFLLAQCKHEQAEQYQTRYERQAADPKQKAAADGARRKAASAWTEAAGWWGRYEPFAAAQDKTFPGRAAHARRLHERASRLAANPAADR